MSLASVSRFRISSSLAALAVAGCASSAPPAPAAAPAPAASSAPAAPVVSESLGRARKARRAYDAVTPPVYAGSGTKEDAFAFMKSGFNDWLDASAPAWGRMLEAYADAARDARDPAGRLAVLDELMDAAVAARKRFVDAASAAMPTAWRSNAELRDVYVGALDARAGNMATTPAAKRCLALTSAPEYAGAVHDRCAAALVSPRSAHEPAPRPPQHWAPVAPWVATSVVGGCAFAGSVNLGPVTLYGSPAGDDVVAKIGADQSLDVERLEPPPTPTGRAHALLRAPLRGEAWIDASARLFALPRKVDVVPGHVWFDEGTRAVGSLEKGALVLRPDPGAKVVAVRSDVTERVACSAARFAPRTPVAPAPAEGAPDRQQVAVPAPDVALAAAPVGSTVGVLHGELLLDLVEIRGSGPTSARAGRPSAWTDGSPPIRSRRRTRT